MFQTLTACGYPAKRVLGPLSRHAVIYTPWRVVYGSAAERGSTSRPILDPAGLWLSSNAIAAYRFAVRFEFSRVIWRAWGMHRLPSDRSICSSSSSSPAASPDSVCLSVEKICMRALERWHTYSSYLEGGRSSDARIPDGRPRIPISNPRDIVALNSTRYFDINGSSENNMNRFVANIYNVLIGSTKKWKKGIQKKK